MSFRCNQLLYWCHMLILFFNYVLHRFNGVIVSVLTSSVADNVLKPRSGQTKDYKIDICCFFGKHAALRSKILVCSESGECVRVEGHNITHELLFCVSNHYTDSMRAGLVQSEYHHQFIEDNVFSSQYS